MHPHSQFPWLLQLESCPSTNTVAMDELEDLQHGTCLWTQAQSAGRGQAGRSWYSDAGVLTASFVIELEQDLLGPAMSMCAGLAVAHCVEDLSNCPLVHIKWPNDCFVQGRKLAGILCEGRPCGDRFRMVIGIGLNVNPSWTNGQAPADSHFHGRPPISIAELGGKPPEMLQVIDSLRSYLLQSVGLIQAQRWQVILPDLRKRDCLLGQSLALEQDGRTVHGLGAGIDEDGSLLIRLPDGGCTRCASSFNLRVMDMIHG